MPMETDGGFPSPRPRDSGFFDDKGWHDVNKQANGIIALAGCLTVAFSILLIIAAVLGLIWLAGVVF